MACILHFHDGTMFDDGASRLWPLLLVDFYSQKCVPCKAILPHLEVLSEQFSDTVQIVTIDVEACPKTTAHYRIQSVPTLLLINRGSVVAQFSGKVTLNALRDFIVDNLRKLKEETGETKK